MMHFEMLRPRGKRNFLLVVTKEGKAFSCDDKGNKFADIDPQEFYDMSEKTNNMKHIVADNLAKAIENYDKVKFQPKLLVKRLFSKPIKKLRLAEAI
jgi:hypothetical protein